jgi:hemerythrin superfamily protein
MEKPRIPAGFKIAFYLQVIGKIQPWRLTGEAIMSNTKEESNAIALLKSDHETVKELFEQFEKAESQDEKDAIIHQAIEELKVHAQIEEEICYPALRGEVDEALMNEAGEEHYVARKLIAELDAHDEQNEERRNAKFTVLTENVRHPISRKKNGR